MSKFQIILITVFSIFIAVGVILFATAGGGNDPSKLVGNVAIWGTVDQSIMDGLLLNLSTLDKSFKGVTYEEKDEQNFDMILVEAIASGSGPDLFMLPQSEILKKQNKITAIPYQSFSERDFKNYFIEEAELYLREDGILALPFMVDPLVMYWNRSLFTGAGVAQPPHLWDEFFVLAKKITKMDEFKNLSLSAVSFGEFVNVDHAKEILATLIMQSGNPIVFRDTEDKINVSLRDIYDSNTTPTESALRFFTEFSNPIKETYSWNRAMDDSKIAFLSGDLAIYFGFASELKDIKLKNPNLNFDIAYMPQTENLKNNVTFGNMQALALSRGSKNIAGAFSVMTNLIKDESLIYLNQLTGLPPVSRTLLSQGVIDPDQEILFQSALSSKGFLDPDDEDTNLIFQDMVEAVVSGRRNYSEAVSWANSELEALIK